MQHKYFIYKQKVKYDNIRNTYIIYLLYNRL